MKISPVIFNYNKNAQFCSNQYYSTEKWAALRDALAKPYKYGIEEDSNITDSLPTLNKSPFTYSDYKSLSPKEKLIIDILINKRADLSYDYDGRKDLSIKKDAERIWEYASKIKEYYDDKYKNGYRLVGIGNSPAPIVETMQLLGADAVTLPFSKYMIELSSCRDFPYERLVPWYNFYTQSYSGTWKKYSTKDWEDYFRFYGVDKDFCKKTGKSLIFTDYVCEGYTEKYLVSILEGIGFDRNYEFIATDMLLPSSVGFRFGYAFSRSLDYSVFKDYARMKSPKKCLREIDIIKHPEYIPSLPESLQAKLFLCAIYNLLEKKNNSV